MGSCFSSAGDSSVSSSALVISPTGDLRPYSTPVFVSDVLQMDESFFVCNSDNLCYDERITPLDAQHQLDAGQIYFVLPVSKLRHPLSASEMAALAVKASVALNNSSSSSSRSTTSKGARRRSKISPFVVMESSKINVIVDDQPQSSSSSLRVSRSGSIRKMQRYSSRKARLAVRSFKLQLSTIYEADQSHNNKYR